MTIFRGPGGTGSATSDSDTTEFQNFLDQAEAARDAALAAQASAELAETNAETAETNAETAETNAETAATNAASSASAAASSASSASTSASNASTSASAASTSATNAASSASSASSSASAASTSASNAATSATSASNSASSASTSATNAANSASTATTQATNAASSATAAASSASSAATSATNAANSASSASTSATNAATSATSAAASASAAAASAASIDPTTLVRTTGTQTIGGDKTFSSNPTLSAGTAKGVAYLNGSKVLTTGSALTFDGTNLGIGTSSPAGKLEVNVGSSAAWFTRVAGDVGVSNAAIGLLTTAATGQIRSYGDMLFYTTTVGGSISEKMRIDSSGNLGLGVTPSAWGSISKAFELGLAGYAVAQVSGFGMTNSANAFYGASGWTYGSTNGASQYRLLTSGHAWFTAPSGTAGNAISFTQALTLSAVGNLLLGGTSDPASAAKAIVIYNGTAPTGNIAGGTLYVEGGALKYRGSSGTVTTIANA